MTIHLAQDVDATFKVMLEPEGEMEKSALSAGELEAAAAKQGVETEDSAEYPQP